MKLKLIVHPAEEGGFWAEAPAVPGCATQGETMDELVANLQEAVKACLSVDIEASMEMRGKVGLVRRLMKVADIADGEL